MAEEDSNVNSESSLRTLDVGLSKGVALFTDFDVRGLGTLAPVNLLSGPTDETVDMRFIEVPTPAWFPDSFLRSMKRNLYFRMVNSASYYGSSFGDANNLRNVGGVNEANASGGGASRYLDFYQEDSSDNIIESFLKSTMKSIVTTAANQVTSVTNKVESVVRGVKSLFGGKGKSEASELFDRLNTIARDPFLNSQPYIKLYGIHLAENVRDAYNAVRGLGSILSTAFRSVFKSGGNIKENFEGMFDKMNAAFVEALSALKLIDGNQNQEFSTKTQNLADAICSYLSNPQMRMHNFSEVQMLSCITGYYTLSCKLPFFNNAAPMFASSGQSSFSHDFGRSGDFGGGYGDNSIVELMKDYTSAVWYKPLEWKPDKLFKSQITPVNYTFNIFNDTLEHVLLNLAFIYSFGATTQAVTDMFTIRPPYLFDIEIPGGLRFKYCLCSFKIYPQGKLRRLSPIHSEGYNSTDDFVAQFFSAVFGVNLNPKAFEYVPDYYKVELQFQSVLPNLWNFIDSYLRDSESKSVLGQPVEHLLKKAITSFSDNFSSKREETENERQNAASTMGA